MPATAPCPTTVAALEHFDRAERASQRRSYPPTGPRVLVQAPLWARWRAGRRGLVVLVVGLTVVLGVPAAVGAAPDVGGGAGHAVATTVPARTSVGFVEACEPGLSVVICEPGPTATPPGTGGGIPVPPTQPAPPGPCVGPGCIPQPTLPPTAPTGPDAGTAGADGGSSCGITDIGGCISGLINDFFRGLVTDALNPLLDLLSQTLLTTPTPQSLPALGGLWANSWQILLASYGLLVLIAGVLLMAYETLQTRYSFKEIAPRIVVGFLAGALSFWAAGQGIEVANGLAAAVMAGGVEPASAGEALRNIVLGSLNDGIFVIFVGLFLVGMILALLVGYVIRVAFAVILIAGAPIALMFHALPQTEGIAFWWWKAFGGCLAIQIVQSLTLITAMRVFLAPGGFTLFGTTQNGLVNLLVACALMYVLYKIPFWVLGSIRGGGRRSLAGSLVRGFIAYKTFGLVSGRSGGGRGRGGSRPERGGRGGAGGGGGHDGGGNSGGGGGGPADPYARAHTTADGQYVLPLPGVRRVRRSTRPDPSPAPSSAGRARGGQGRQLALPLGEDWPEHRPVLGKDGQYRLPITARRVPRPTAPTGPRPGGTQRGAGTQLELPLDPYRGNRPTSTGQYPLPLDGVRRVPRPVTPSPIPPPPPAARVSRPRVVQPELPFDPYAGNRPTRSGQYPLPLDDVERVPHPRPAPPTPAPVAPSPAGGTRVARRGGQQLRLPLDLPTPARRATPARRTGNPGGTKK